jgi:2-oxoglutarate dehydrogenase E1 component
MYISDTPTKRFVQQRLEPIRSRPNIRPTQQAHPRAADGRRNARALPAHEVRRAEALLGRGGPRTLIPMLDRLIEKAGPPASARSSWAWRIAAAERPRQHARQDAVRSVQRVRRQAGAELPAGDVKYHQGFSSDVSTPGGAVH